MHCFGDRCFDFYVFKREVAQDFVAHKKGNLIDQLTEIFGWGVLAAQNGQLMLDERMWNDLEFSHGETSLCLFSIFYQKKGKNACENANFPNENGDALVQFFNDPCWISGDDHIVAKGFGNNRTCTNYNIVSEGDPC